MTIQWLLELEPASLVVNHLPKADIEAEGRSLQLYISGVHGTSYDVLLKINLNSP